MQTHQIDLSDSPSDTPTTENITPTPIAATSIPVDDPALNNDNQRSGPKLRHYSDKATPMAKRKPSKLITVATVVLAIVLGVGTGYVVQAKLPSANQLAGSGSTPIAQVATGTVNTGDVFGSANTESFPDSAQGYLESGGIDGEGSHSLLRPGGPSQTVYLTSSVTDLSKLEGMEVKVWGETFRAQKAGWLMDVGRVEVINTSGEKPE